MHTGEDRRHDQRGQATVEMALVLPVFLLMALIVLQVGLVLKDSLLVHHAAREAARAGAVEPSGSTIRTAAVGAGGLRADRLSVSWSGGDERGQRAAVTVRYRAPTAVPLVGRLIDDVPLEATVTMRIE